MGQSRPAPAPARSGGATCGFSPTLTVGPPRFTDPTTILYPTEPPIETTRFSGSGVQPEWTIGEQEDPLGDTVGRQTVPPLRSTEGIRVHDEPTGSGGTLVRRPGDRRIRRDVGPDEFR